MQVLDAEQSAGMETEGREVRARRVRLGMSIKELADEAGVSSDTIGDYEAGRRRTHEAKVAKIVATLDRIEHEVGYDAPAVSTDEGLVEIEVLGPDGKTAVAIVKGPVRDRDQLAEMVARLIRDARADG